MNSIVSAFLVAATCVGLGEQPLAESTSGAPPRGDAGAFEAVLRLVPASGGVAVHLGCGDGGLLLALAKSGPWVAQGLDDDLAAVQAARRRIVAANLWGRITVSRWTGQLPYIDNVVNLLICEHPDWVARDELLRVLAPGGMALLRTPGGWEKLQKPWPDDIDQWTHYLHDADGNAVANDRRTGPPRTMQWMADPLWARYHHTLASISSVVSAGGRLFAIIDDAPSASIEVPGRWSLVCRDAFNGVLLWKKPMKNWAWWRQRFRSGPVQLPRLLVTDGHRVYAPLGISTAVSILDAATGEVLAECPDTDGAEEIVLHDGRLLVVTGRPLSEQALIDPVFAKRGRFPNEKQIVAVDAKTGKTIWQCPAERVGSLVPLTLAAANGAVFYANQEAVVCLAADDGTERWRRNLAVALQGGPTGRRKAGKAARQSSVGRTPGWSVTTLVVADGVLLLADGKQLRALDATDGQLLWQVPCPPGFRSPNDVFVIDGLVWTGHLFNEGRDLRTGQVKRTMGVLPDLWTAGHHHRCYREKATCRYILTSYRGIEFVDLADENHSRNNWVRGGCQYGVMPCNGLVYAPSHACGCYMEGKLFGFWALAPNGRSLALARNEVPSQERLERGPAFGAASERSADQPASDWPTYRHDPLRSGSTPVEVGSRFEPRWTAKVGGRITPPVVAENMVLVASVDRHRVVALDAATGKVRWEFIAGGRVDSPPTVWQGRVLFGSADGHVYCLRAEDGASMWRFLAAPAVLHSVVREQLESVWPVHGSVLVENGVAYVAAGRYSYLDGGFWLYALDVATGRVLHRGRVQGKHPKGTEGTTHEPIRQFDQNSEDSKTRLAPDRSDAFSMFAARSDVLVSDGHSIYLHTLRLDRHCKLQATAGRHLFSTSRLLDGEENHRSHWVLGTGDFSRVLVAYSWIANGGGVRKSTQMAVPYGLMMAFDEQTVWAVRRGKRYRLLAHPNRPFSPNEKPLPDFRPLDRAKGKQPPTEWSVELPLRPRAIVRAGSRLVLGGTPTKIDPADPYATFEGRSGGVLWIGSAADGTQQAVLQLDSAPVWDGLAVTADGLFVARTDGTLLRLAPAQ